MPEQTIKKNYMLHNCTNVKSGNYKLMYCDTKGTMAIQDGRVYGLQKGIKQLLIDHDCIYYLHWGDDFQVYTTTKFIKIYT